MRRHVIHLRALAVLRHHPARAGSSRRRVRRRVARREIEVVRAFARVAARRRQTPALASGGKTAPRLSRDVVVTLAVGRPVAGKNRPQAGRREAVRKRIGRAERRVIRLEALRVVGRFGRQQVLRRKLIGVNQTAAVAVSQDLVIGGIGAEDELRAVGTVDEPVGVFAEDQRAQVRVRIDVLLVLELFDRIAVVISVAVARIDRAADGAIARAAGKEPDDQIARLRRLHERTAVIERIEVRHRVPDASLRTGLRSVPDVVRGAQILVGDAARHVEHLNVVAQGRIAMRNSNVEIDDVLAVEVYALRVAVAGRVDEAVVGRLSARAVEDVVDVVVGRHVERIEIERIADAAELIAVAVRLIRPREPDVIRKEPVGRRAGDFDRRLMVEGRRADSEIGVGVSGIGAGLDDLIDVAGKSRRVRRGRRSAGIDLHFLISQRRQRRNRRQIRLARGRQSVELVGDLIDVAAADVDALVPALLIRGDVDARSAGDRAVGLGERARAVEGGRRLLTRRSNRVDVAGHAGTHQRLGRSRRRARDRLERALQREGRRRGLIGDDGDARFGLRLVAGLARADGIRVGLKRNERKRAGSVGEALRRLRGRRRDHQDARQRRARGGVEDVAAQRPGRSGNRRLRGEEDKQRQDGHEKRGDIAV